jgi:hypothetical protein
MPEAMWWLCPSCLNAFEENIGPHHAADDEAQIPDCGTDLILVAPVDLSFDPGRSGALCDPLAARCIGRRGPASMSPVDRKLPLLETEADRLIWVAEVCRRRIDEHVQPLLLFLDSLPRSEESRKAQSHLHSILNALVVASNEGYRIERLRAKQGDPA